MTKQDHTVTDPVAATWLAWTKEPGGNEEKRRLLVQIINASRLAYKWQSFDAALANFRFMGCGPDAAQESLAEAAVIATRCKWTPSKCRAEFS